MASAPEIHTRTDDRSRSEAPASHIIRYIAGTPMNSDDFRASRASSTSVGRNRPRKNTGMPAHARPTRAAKPMMWAMGRPTTASSRRSQSGLAAPALTAPIRARWVSSAPFGLPVVPEV